MTAPDFGMYLRGRRSRAWLATWAACFVVLVAASSLVITVPIRFLDGRTTRWTPIWELLPALLGASSGALISPRLASWELTGVRRVRLGAASSATGALVLPAILPWANHFLLPADARWIDITSNVLAIASISLVAVALLGPLYGTLLALLTYGGAITIQHADPDIGRRIPFSGIVGNVEPHFAFAGALGVLAVAVWTATRGESRLAYRLRRND